DTQDETVAKVCLEAGADIINDVSALTQSASMGAIIAEHGAGVVLMHMRGTPRTMQENTHYSDLLGEIVDFLRERVEVATQAGIPPSRIWVDPGIGFGKSLEGNLEILRRINEIDQLGRPVVMGVSRKSFIGKILDRDVQERVPGTVAVTSWLASSGVKRIHRVHDVVENRDALRMIESILEAI
ncbi:MAG: dihydropteroate synthase, partial [Candidatus Omnitrophica bacterium]|nr:dihydropteroate synthase [Candidatus Omnitrophota bacterium]